jgi:hypothetical protein
VPPGVACQDEAGRLWEVAWMLACAMRRGGSGPSGSGSVPSSRSNRRSFEPGDRKVAQVENLSWLEQAGILSYPVVQKLYPCPAGLD